MYFSPVALCRVVCEVQFSCWHDRLSRDAQQFQIIHEDHFICSSTEFRQLGCRVLQFCHPILTPLISEQVVKESLMSMNDCSLNFVVSSESLYFDIVRKYLHSIICYQNINKVLSGKRTDVNSAEMSFQLVPLKAEKGHSQWTVTFFLFYKSTCAHHTWHNNQTNKVSSSEDDSSSLHWNG